MNVRFESTPDIGVEFHPLANLFPLMQGAALNELREDIRAHGVLEPIVFLGRAILDGRNRYMCARDLGIEYPRVEFGGDDPLAFVVSHNLHRRHLSESQRSMVAGKLANMPSHRPSKDANLHPYSAAVSKADAARLLNVSPRSVASARKVLKDGVPELIDLVESGGSSVSAAAEAVASLSPEEQRAAALIRQPLVTRNTGNFEWYTPHHIIDLARDVLGGIDFDPASSEIANRTVQATRFFTAEDDGLQQEWPVGRIWMNPPYATRLIRQFVSRFCAEIERGSSGIVLVNNATETEWFEELFEVYDVVCFPKGRLRFVPPDGLVIGGALQGQAIFYFGEDIPRFKDAFRTVGRVVRDA